MSQGTAAATRALKTPLAVRMRPKTLEEVVGQQHLLQSGSPLKQLAAEGAQTVSVILWGPPGTGKTTIAQALAQATGKRFVELSAVTAGIKDVRQVMEQALNNRDLYAQQTLLFLDEIHRFSKSQQDALLPGVENGWVTLIAATTENPSFAVISPLLSRSLQLVLKPLTEKDLTQLIERAIVSPVGLNSQVRLAKDAEKALVQFADGDARRALTSLEAVASVALTKRVNIADSDAQNDGVCESADNKKAAATEGKKSQEKPVKITLKDVEQVLDRALVRYDKDGDQHYDVISAFIKSIRGSNPDAALHYLARMIEAGEDARFIARRLMVHAAEDIGMADPQALVVATAAAQATQLVGLPEARIPLAEATIYLATAPKSNAVISAIDAAISDVRAGKSGQVPKHLRDAHYAGAKSLGHGVGYKYPHSDDRGVLRQQYLPDALRTARYYEPKKHGYERRIAEQLAAIREITGN